MATRPVDLNNIKGRIAEALVESIFRRAGRKRETGYFSSRDIFWLRDESLEDSDNLPDPDALAQKIVDDLEAALEQFREIEIGRAHV